MKMFHASMMMFVIALFAPTFAFAHGGDLSGDHPDLEVEVEYNGLHTHPEGAVYAQFEKFQFTKPSSTWRATFPGFEGDASTGLGANKEFDLHAIDQLYWYNAGTGAFVDTPGGESLRIVEDYTGGFGSIDVPGSGGTYPLVLSPFAGTDGSGLMHRHPQYQLKRDGGDPTDGAYLLGLQIHDAAGVDPYVPTETFWLLFHKGLTDEADYEAAHEAAIAFVPEPATLTLLGLGGMTLLRRRK